MNPVHSRRSLAGLAVIGLGASIAPLDFAVNIAFPAITQAFGLETRAIRWVAVCYVMTHGSLMLAFGALGDRVGHLRVFRAGLLLAALAFTLCALAPTYSWLLAARLLQGVAVALTLSCAPALATLLFDEERRSWALSAYASMAALAGVVAPLVGGASIAYLGWAGVYWFRVPVVLLAAAGISLLGMRGDAPAARPRGEFDFPSAVLLALAMALLLLASALAGPDRIPAAVAAFTAGAILAAAFVRRQKRSAAPFLPRAVLRDRDFIVSNLASVVVQFASFAIPLVVPYYLTRAGWSPLASGALLAVWAVGTLAGSSAAVRVVRGVGVWRAVLLSGALAVAGLIGVACWSAVPQLAVMVACLFVEGLGLGLFQVAYTDLVMAALPRSARGVAGSLSLVTRIVGIVAAASGLTAILQSVESGQLGAGVAAPQAFMAGFARVFMFASLLAAAFLMLAQWYRRDRRAT